VLGRNLRDVTGAYGVVQGHEFVGRMVHMEVYRLSSPEKCDSRDRLFRQRSPQNRASARRVVGIAAPQATHE
jgi:hypothetical protein